LRAAGVQTRLVCSLQVLPLGPTSVKGPAPPIVKSAPNAYEKNDKKVNTSKSTAVLPATDATAASATPSTTTITIADESPQPLVPRFARRLGFANATPSPGHIDVGVAPKFDGKKNITKKSPMLQKKAFLFV
jgi:hypothetical protein